MNDKNINSTGSIVILDDVGGYAKRDRVVWDNKLQTSNNMFIQRIVNHKNLTIGFNRHENYLKQKDVIAKRIAKDLDAENKNILDKGSEYRHTVMNQIQKIKQHVPYKLALNPRKAVFSLYTKNNISRSLEFQEEVFRKDQHFVEENFKSKVIIYSKIAIKY
jgi:hypothetical protein